MVTPKSRGTRWEYRVAHRFERWGYEWRRSGSSLGVYDLLITKGGRPQFLVSCKKTMGDRLYIPLEEVEELRREARGMGARPLVCFGFRRTSPLVCELGRLRRSGGESYRLERGDGEPLDEWLGRRKRCRKA
ncbi:MAG: hypothetical protein QXM46_02060 [Candidatus Hadarchaeales archaeon]